ncbi:MAG: agmatine deiminase family protein [Salinivirgaceae bacterium]|jgi:agmatine deiminase|nr:T9SS type A sorting domain-containing protein [Bacteroidales bacterium]
MLRILSLFMLILIVSNSFGQGNLPKGMTEYEKSIWEDYIKNYPFDRGTNPPDQTPRTPAEFEENQGVIVTWTQYTSNLREIVRHAKESVKVYIVCSNPSSVTSYLSQGGIDTNNIEFVVADYNSVWVRDYGPQSIYLHGTNELAFVDWVYNRPRPKDDTIPIIMGNYLNVPVYQMTATPNRLTATGGNFMNDGFGKGFSSKLILTENSSLTEAQIDTIKKRYMGISPYVKMTVLPYDGIHHIDMHMKLIDEETLLVGQYPQGVSDGPQIEANINYILNNYQTSYGRPYRVVRIPMPPDENGKYPSQGSHYLTYTNATILNNLVLVPIYGLSTDNEALNIYREAMPGYKVVGINMRNVIPASGAIHCITREIAANDPIFIAHAPIRDTMNYIPGGYLISANISSATGIQSVTLCWSADTTLGFDEIAMEYVNNNYEAYIPSSNVDGDLFYYIKAVNNNNKTINKPLVAPAGLYRFHAYGSGEDYNFDFSTSALTAFVDEDITFTFENNGVEANSFAWNFGKDAYPQTSNSEGPHIVTYLTSGSKTITLTVNGTMTIRKNNFVQINDRPLHNISISVVGNGSVTPLQGNYQLPYGHSIKLTANPDENWKFSKWVVNNEESSDNPINIGITQDITAIAHFEWFNSISKINQKGINIYPNPANESLFIEFNETDNVNSISITDISGNIVTNINSFSELNQIEIDLANYTSGIYFVLINTDNGVEVFKFVKI